MGVLKSEMTNKSLSPETPERLMEAAGWVFAEKGFRNATIRDICKRAGANIAAVNYHFGDKEHLYIEVIKYAHRTLVKYQTDLGLDDNASAEERLKAFATITFDNCFVVRDLKIINGNNGLFVAMPSKKRKDGQFKDIAHPLNNDCRNMIETKVLGEYSKMMKERGEASPPPRAMDEGDYEEEE